MQNTLSLQIDDHFIETAFRIAKGDFLGNIQLWQGEMHEQPAPCIWAGLDYPKPWTRDAAVNSWYAGSLVTPHIARNTLLSVLKEDAAGLRIGGQYWDAIIWVTAAWNHYLCTGDKAFLQTAYTASVNSLRYFEKREFDPEDNLFRGAACFIDGISGYPDSMADRPRSSILAWVEQHPKPSTMPGVGLPIKTLSTNCLYYNAYKLVSPMAKALDLPVNSEWETKASRLKTAINESFWSASTGKYRYVIDAGEDGDWDEGFGHAFALLFGIADADKTASILERQYISEHGIPCIWPTFKRYTNVEGTSFGRQSGTIWPQVNAAWAVAAAKSDRWDRSWSELRLLAQKVCRDGQFFEIYHPLTGEPYGGRQENRHGMADTLSRRRQTWCATGFIYMVLSTLFGQDVSESGIRYSPHLPPEISKIKISGLAYRGASLAISVAKTGDQPRITLNNVDQKQAFIAADSCGELFLKILVPEKGVWNQR